MSRSPRHQSTAGPVPIHRPGTTPPTTLETIQQSDLGRLLPQRALELAGVTSPVQEEPHGKD